MARQLRIELAGGLYHVLTRGNEKRKIFKSLGDRDRFLSLLPRAYEKYACRFYTYSLLPNHFHLLVETKKKNLSRVMHFINASYSIYFNKRHERVGHLFQGRYKAIIVQKESYLLELSRYIHTNADRAGFEGKINDRKWTSYCYYTESCKKPAWLCIEWIIDRFGKDWPTAKKEYKRFVKDGLRNGMRDPFENTYRDTILGSESFIEKTKRSLKKELSHDISSHRSFSKFHTFDSVIGIVSEYFKVPSTELFERRRLFLPRQIAMYLLKEHTDLTLKEIGQHFNISGFSVSMNANYVKKNKRMMGIVKRINELLKKG
jgi:putative transposase